MFTARYGLILYMEQITFRLKRLSRNCWFSDFTTISLIPTIDIAVLKEVRNSYVLLVVHTAQRSFMNPFMSNVDSNIRED